MNQFVGQFHNTKKFLERSYGRVLPDEEVLKQASRLTQFFSLLIEIDQKNKRKEANKNG